MRSEKKKVVLVAPLGNPNRRPRLHKYISILRGFGEVEYWGWARAEADRVADKTSILQRNILFGGGFRNRFVYALYPLWTLMVFLNLIIFRPKKVIAMGLETASACYLASFIFDIDYIYDDPDRFVLIINMPSLIKRFLTEFEKLISRTSAMHIIPSVSRYDYQSHKFFVLQNTPTRAQYEYALARKPNRPDGFVVYVNGLLTESRGLRFITEAAIELSATNASVIFIVASKGHDVTARRFFSLPNVTYLGELSPNDALSYYAVSDVVLTFYDPCVDINRYAMPNKWGDALCFGTKIIVNQECLTAKWLIEVGSAEAVRFGDSRELVLKLRELAEYSKSNSSWRDHNNKTAGEFAFFDDASRDALHQFVSR